MTAGAVGRPLWGPFVVLVGLVVVVDQAMKAWISSALAGGNVIHVIGEYVRLVYSRNDGALFGLFRGQAVVFSLLSLLVIGLIVTYHARSGRSPYLTLTLGLLLGGAIGNAIDRFRLGYVIDFVDGGVGTVRFYTFNFADACISTAVALLLVMAIWPSLTEGRRNPGPGADVG